MEALRIGSPGIQHSSIPALPRDYFLDEFPLDRLEPTRWHASADCGVFA